jgi:hypothetical protein
VPFKSVDQQKPDITSGYDEGRQLTLIFQGIAHSFDKNLPRPPQPHQIKVKFIQSD